MSSNGSTTEFQVRRLVLEFDNDKATLVDFEDVATLLVTGERSKIMTRHPDEMRDHLPPPWVDFFDRQPAMWKLISNLDALPIKVVPRKKVESKDPLTRAFSSQTRYRRKGVVRLSGQLGADGSFLKPRFEQVMGSGLDETALGQAVRNKLPVSNKKLIGQRVTLDIGFDVY